MGAIEEHGQNDMAWRDFLRGHGGDIEDAMLTASADFERENRPADDPSGAAPVSVQRPTWGEVKRANMTGAGNIEYVDRPDDTQEMRYFKAVSEEGTRIEGFIPTTLPDDGIRVKVDGSPGILYVHPDGDVHLDETEPVDVDEVTVEHLMEMSKIGVMPVGYNPATERQLYGVSLSDEFVLSLREAWMHVDHEGSLCKETADSYLTRFVQQFVAALRPPPTGGGAE